MVEGLRSRKSLRWGSLKSLKVRVEFGRERHRQKKSNLNFVGLAAALEQAKYLFLTFESLQ